MMATSQAGRPDACVQRPATTQRKIPYRPTTPMLPRSGLVQRISRQKNEPKPTHRPKLLSLAHRAFKLLARHPSSRPDVHLPYMSTRLPALPARLTLFPFALVSY